MAIRKVVVIHDIRDLMYLVEDSIPDMLSYIFSLGPTLEDFVHWIICEEIERVFYYSVNGHRKDVSPYVDIYYTLQERISSYALTQYVVNLVSLPRFNWASHFIDVKFVNTDLHATFSVEYNKIF